MMLEAGASPEAQSHNGSTANEMSMEAGAVAIVELFKLYKQKKDSKTRRCYCTC